MNKSFLKGFDPEVKRFVNSVIDSLTESGVLNETMDILALRMLAQAYQDFIASSKAVKEQGMVITTVQGLVVSPLYKICKDSQMLCRQLIAEFGLSPKARKKILPELSAKEEEDPFSRFSMDETEE